MSDDAVILPIETPLDQQSANQSANQLEDIFERKMSKSKLGERIAGTINRSLEKVDASKIFDPLGSGSKAAVANLGNVSRKIDEARLDFVALEERAQATRATLAKTGADPKIFAVFDRAISAALGNLREFEDELRQGTATPAKFEQLEAALRESNKTAQKEVAGIQSTLKTLTAAESKAAEARRVERQQANQLILQEQRRAHGREITELQGHTARVLLENRQAGQRQLQDERQRSRTRIEIVRFTFNQIRQLERGIAGIFRASGTILSTTAGAIGASLNRIGGLFRRSNVDMNDGLRGALLRREQSLS